MGTVFSGLRPRDFALLPAAVRAVHGDSGRLVMTGRADVEVAPGAIARLVTALAGLPAAGCDVPVTVVFDRGAEAERWERRFGARRYRSRMVAGRGRDAGLLVERLGLFDNVFRLQPTPAGLGWHLVRFRLLGLDVPAALRPGCEALEYADGEGRFAFDIAVDLPGLGRVIRYRGWLVSA